MVFHPVRFPLDIALGARGGPRWQTDVVSLVSGAEQRNQRWASSRRRYNAGYGIKSIADLETVIAFFEERRGRLHSFLFRDPFDWTSGAVGAGVTATDQALGTGDGATLVFQIIKTYGALFDPAVRRITKPVTGTVRVAVDGGELVEGAGFSVDHVTGLISFSSPPAGAAVLTSGFEFDVETRFDTDRLDLEIAGFDAANAPDIPLIELV
ncbi:MAG: DUF2460 domain-containing protein [Alphaproteobacteria bacterium]|nr:DUF2460 domain-containing protein [Alphaproteobacteria bacterium]